MKVLSKSRFKVGLECPNKLYYTFHKDHYPNVKLEDTFLLSLAQGGFQVEELARMHFPGGQLIDTPLYDYQGAVDQTKELLLQDEVVIYEAAFLWDGLFIRTDILEKKGNHLRLIEVKAKLFDSLDEYAFVGKRGGLVSGWKPYLFDLAFQAYVVKKAFPEYHVTSHLMMADKHKASTVDGLNQMFRVPKAGEGDQRKGIAKSVTSLEETGESILVIKNLSSLIAEIHEDQHSILPGYSFESGIQFLKETYQSGNYPNWPTTYSSCKNCEFKATREQVDSGLKSGFHDCMGKQHGWTTSDFDTPSVFQIWNFKGKSIESIFNENRLRMNQLTEDDFKVERSPSEITASERRWIQVEKAISGDRDIYCLKEELKNEMANWKFPLHFIDFETSGVALPFTKGSRPYEQVAFQFSHHTVDADGKVCHQTEFLLAEPGVFPNFEFARALRAALGQDQGSIFKFASHENTILNVIIQQLKASKEEDKEELIEFLKSITKPTKDNTDQWEGSREMIDLRKIVMAYYYNPLTKGSNSIKYLLPAVLETSTALQNKYSESLASIGVSSRNFSPDHRWIQTVDGVIKNPYQVLPPLFEGWSEEEVEDTISGMDSIGDGGMALTAYAKLQYVDMLSEERLELMNGLKKYCELDTLAMVMIYEHFKEVTTA